MGTSKRYADSVDRAMNTRIAQSEMRNRTPATLSAGELDLDEVPLTRTPTPLPVTAWVRYGDAPFRVDARAVAWTARAVAVEWQVGDGQLHRAWVWASAVETRRA